MQFWIIGFILLLGGAEIYQWLKHFSLPLPVFILGGVFLAIVSNTDKHLPFRFSLHEPDPSPAPPTKSSATPTPSASSHAAQSSSSPNLPQFQQTKQTKLLRSISFEIKKNKSQSEP
jgi:hypothetical protein